jgi:pilus assembly protein Flp/PilA
VVGSQETEFHHLFLVFRGVEFEEIMLFKSLVRLYRDEEGGEVLEYAIVAGLIVVAAISVIGKVGSKVLARWNSLNSSM